MNEITLKCGFIVPSSSILGYVGDGSVIGEWVKSVLSREDDIGKPIIETRLEFYKSPADPRVLCYRQFFPCSNSSTGRHIHGENTSGGQIEGRSGSYILFINGGDYENLQRLRYLAEYAVD